jgi:hypothetical protein
MSPMKLVSVVALALLGCGGNGSASGGGDSGNTHDAGGTRQDAMGGADERSSGDDGGGVIVARSSDGGNGDSAHTPDAGGRDSARSNADASSKDAGGSHDARAISHDGGCGARSVDLSRLPVTAAPNPSAYAALHVPAMVEGTAFADPVTGVRMVKLTDSSKPTSGGQFGPMYSTLGLQISQPWGPCLDQYTLFFVDVAMGGAYLVDYTLGGTPTNYRSVAVSSPGSGMSAFSRRAGQAQIMYISTGTELRMYDTGTNAYADTGMFPIPWKLSGWLQLNHDETWATGLDTASIVTALNLTTGQVLSHTMSGLDELYSGYNNVALINCDADGSGATAAYWWDLDTDTLTSLGLPYGNLSLVSHVPSLNGFWMAPDTNTGGGHTPFWQVNDNLTHDQLSTLDGYWGQFHQCGHWQQGAGNAQYFLWSTFGEVNADGSPAPGYQYWTADLKWNLLFIRSSDASTAVLGHHYSISPYADTGSGSALEYWSQPHATQSTDGALVLYGSNMNVANGRIDAFLAEVPTAP